MMLCLFISCFSSSVAASEQPNILWLKDTISFNPNSNSEGLFSIVQDDSERIYTAQSPDGAGTFLHGYVNKKGDAIIPYQYFEGYAFSDGFAYVRKQTSNGINDELIDKGGNSVKKIETIAQSGHLIHDNQNGYVLWLKPGIDQYYGISDTAGNLLVPIEYDYLELPSEGLCLSLKDGHYGFVNIDNEVVIPHEYDNALSFTEGLSAVEINGEWGYINKANEMIISPQYIKAAPFSEGLASVSDLNGTGAINQKGQVIIPLYYDYVGLCQENRIRVKMDERFGYFDRNGEKVIGFNYGAALDFHDNLAIVSWEDFSEQEINNVDDFWYIGAATVCSFNNQLKPAKFGMIDCWGNVIIPPDYTCISNFNDGVAMVQRDTDENVGILSITTATITEPTMRNFIRFYIDNQLVTLSQEPLICNDQTYVPLRSLSDALDAQVTWDNSSKIATINKGAIELELTEFDTPLKILNNRIYIPLRLISEQLNFTVLWQQDEYAIYLTSK